MKWLDVLKKHCIKKYFNISHDSLQLLNSMGVIDKAELEGVEALAEVKPPKAVEVVLQTKKFRCHIKHRNWLQ